jgi:hypothetical protein
MFLTALCLTNTSQAQAIQPLESLEVMELRESFHVTVNLRIPLQYIRHYPDSRGRDLTVEVRLADGRAKDSSLRRNTLQWKGHQNLPLQNVEFEEEASDSGLILFHFTRVAEYSVQGGKDFRSIEVVIKKDSISDAKESKTEKTRETDTEKTGQVKATEDSKGQAPEQESGLIDIGTLSDSKQQRLLASFEEAKTAFTARDYDIAIRLFTRLLRYSGHPYLRQSLEYLALSRERKGQLAHARAEYEKYLRLYPEGEGSDRVRQRLTALVTAALPEKQALKEVDREGNAAKRAEASKTDFYGSLSQYYYYDESGRRQVVEGEEGEEDEVEESNETTRSTLVTGVFLGSRKRAENHTLDTQLVAEFENEFADEEESDSRFSQAYADYQRTDNGLGIRFGRQSGNSGGVLTRFDGAWLSYEASDTLAYNFVFGYPVNQTRDSLKTNRRFYGLNLDLGTFAEAWDFNIHAINQEIDGLTDRQGIGGEVRYFRNGLSLFTLVDYDVFYDELDLFLFLGNWRASDDTTLYYSYDKRKSPLLRTINALQGQQEDSIQDLLERWSEEEIYQFAEDRTAESEIFNLGLTHDFADHWQVANDLTVSEFSETQASGGVEATPATGQEYFYSFQLSRSDLFLPYDVNTLNIRYQDTSSSEKWTLRLLGRYPLSKKLRIKPKFEISSRDRKSGSGGTDIVELSSTFYYKVTRKYSVDLELGYENRKDEFTGLSFDEDNVFIYIGNRYDF